MPSIVFYISGHGFGHASRQVEVINQLLPALRGVGHHHTVIVRSAADPWLLDHTLRVPVERMPVEVDTGMVQIDSLHLDEEASFRAAREFYGRFEARAREETEFLKAIEARLVVSDIPALPFEAAHRAKIPSLGIGNFTWDWIYEGYPDHSPDAGMIISTLRVAYRKCTRALRLPLHGGFATFPDVADIPFIARHAQQPRDVVRAAFGIPADRPAVLTSFGAYGISALGGGAGGNEVDAHDWTIVTTGRSRPAASAPSTASNVLFVDENAIYSRGFRYEDLVGAVDVVLSKPGYGIVSECVANDTALVYTSRGRFPEYDVFVDEMPRYVRCEFISNENLAAGRWRAALEAVMQQPTRPRVATDGADVAVAEVLGYLK